MLTYVKYAPLLNTSAIFKTTSQIKCFMEIHSSLEIISQINFIVGDKLQNTSAKQIFWWDDITENKP
jgi:hypothetical protein